MSRNFRALLEAQWSENKFLCVGLDPVFDQIPGHLQELGLREGLLAFNKGIIDATRSVAGAYKPNSAFFEAYGSDGWAVLKETAEYIRSVAPATPVIADCKRGDIGSTNKGYAEAIFGDLGADAVTVHPYLGSEALKPFLERDDKGIIVLCRTSNDGAREFQDLRVGDIPLYQVVARTVAEKWNTRGNCGLVVGATYPEELRIVRSIAPELPILIPGIGAQGGDLEKTVQFGRNAAGTGMIISSSRSIMYASGGEDFVEAAAACAQSLHGAITEAAVR